MTIVGLTEESFHRTANVVKAVERSPIGERSNRKGKGVSQVSAVIPCRNSSGEAIPDNSIAEITSVYENSYGAVGYVLGKPSEDNLTNVVLVKQGIPINEDGYCLHPSDISRTHKVRITGTPAIKDEVGTATGSWTLATEKTGFQFLGESGGLSYVRPFRVATPPDPPGIVTVSALFSKNILTTLPLSAPATSDWITFDTSKVITDLLPPVDDPNLGISCFGSNAAGPIYIGVTNGSQHRINVYIELLSNSGIIRSLNSIRSVLVRGQSDAVTEAESSVQYQFDYSQMLGKNISALRLYVPVENPSSGDLFARLGGAIKNTKMCFAYKDYLDNL